jgi:hypothetical protein
MSGAKVYNQNHAPPLPTFNSVGGRQWLAQAPKSIDLPRLLPCGDDAQCVALLKAHMVEGGRFDALYAGTERSILELLADAQQRRGVGVGVIEFLLRHGAPVVLIDARGATHDAFVAFLNAGAAVPVLRRFVQVGYEPALSLLLQSVACLRDNAPVHAFLCDLLAAHAPVAPLPQHFSRGSDAAALLLELDRVQYVQCNDAFLLLFERLLGEAEFHPEPRRVLARRLFDTMPDAAAAALRSRLVARQPVHCDALAALLPRLVAPDAELCGALIAAVLAPQPIDGSAVDAPLVGLVLDLAAGVAEQLPLLAMAAAVGPAMPADVLRLLLARGADPNRRAADGRTPLHCSTTLEHLCVLVAGGADRTLLDADGRTPLDVARAANRIDESFYLLKEVDALPPPVVHFELAASDDAAAPAAAALMSTPPRAVNVLDQQTLARIGELAGGERRFESIDDVLAAGGVVPELVKLSIGEKRESAVAALADLCLCVTSDEQLTSLLADGALSVLMSCLVPQPSAELARALDALRAIGARSDALRDRVLSAGGAVRLLNVVQSRAAGAALPAARLAATLVGGDEAPAEAQARLLIATFGALLAPDMLDEQAKAVAMAGVASVAGDYATLVFDAGLAQFAEEAKLVQRRGPQEPADERAALALSRLAQVTAELKRQHLASQQPQV